MRTIPLAVLLALAAAGPATAKSWSIDCVAGACAAIDAEGNIAFIDLEKQTVIGVDKLGSEPTAPVSISCSAKSVGEGCVVVDGAGRLWFGPVRPGTPYKPATDARLP